MAALSAGIPLGRVGQPEEIAGLAAYLAPHEADQVTGATHSIDGAMMRHALGPGARRSQANKKRVGAAMLFTAPTR